MPWKESSVIDQRRDFINEVLERIKPFKEICLEYGISTKTGYKWFNRFLEEGYEGLRDHSRRPLGRHPQQLAEEVICELIALKLNHMSFGPKKVLDLYCRIHAGAGPSLSSVKRILKRVGLVKRRRKRRRFPGRLTSEIQVEAPNDLWTVDFKGWWWSSDHRRVEPLTIRDAYSRMVLAVVAVPDLKTETIQKIFERVFREYGLPKAIQSDNGTPFAAPHSVLGLSRLSAWLLSLGINLHRSRPGHPQDNGGHERMHRDLKEQVQVRFRGSLKQYEAELELWRKEFNEVRPHEALGMKTPAEVYNPSPRKYAPLSPEIDYPLDYQVRKVGGRGMIRYANERYFITKALGGYTVGLKAINSSELAVYFTKVLLGIIDLKTLAFIPEKGFKN